MHTKIQRPSSTPKRLGVIVKEPPSNGLTWQFQKQRIGGLHLIPIKGIRRSWSSNPWTDHKRVDSSSMPQPSTVRKIRLSTWPGLCGPYPGNMSGRLNPPLWPSRTSQRWQRVPYLPYAMYPCLWKESKNRECDIQNSPQTTIRFLNALGNFSYAWSKTFSQTDKVDLARSL